MTAAKTLTGNFPIGIRLTGPLAERPVLETARWAISQGFGCVDIPANQLANLDTWPSASLPVGTIDLFGSEWTGMLSADAITRRTTVVAAKKFIRDAAAAGARIIFVVMLAEDVKLSRRETFGYMVETYGQLRDVLAETGLHLAIEGWPGCNAHCCNPESYRAFLKEMNSSHFGINYDPSHLIRMGIDPLRFIKEFAPQVVHMHGKDTLIDDDRLYEIGHEQDGVFAANFPWGGFSWRYTIPGKGRAPWSELLAELVAVKYRGYVSIELEDVDYNGTLAGEQRGFVEARKFLQSI
jgi:sugar phosphate isomerase/epimerase|uniref:sugar phosphate isomerase/epimerase family protein n=1 Tax=Cephaloticoccus sp. TaxID=1985742 RepID=UPI004049CD32